VLLDAHGPHLKMNRENLNRLYEKAKHLSVKGSFTSNLERYYHYRLEVVGGITYNLTQISHAWWRKKEDPKLASDPHQRFVDLDHGNPVVERGVNSFDQYLAEGFQYVVTTSGDYEPYLTGLRAKSFPTTHGFYVDLMNRGVLVKEFIPDAWNHSGPTVKIFRFQGAL